ncbi:hypothetical protein LRR80_06423 [Streptomyces sp. RO-S4]|nr:hypothetical protein [Streptomyces sp. RO-S4]
MRVRVAPGVVGRRAVQDVHGGVLGERGAREDRVVRGHMGVEPHRRVVAQRLLDQVVDVLRMRPEPLRAGGFLGGVPHRVGQQHRAGLQRGDGDEHGQVVDDPRRRLRVVREPRVPVVDPAGEDIVARARPPVADQLPEEGPHLHRGLARERQLLLRREQFLRVRLPVGEVQDVRVVLLGDAQPLADRADREEFGDRLDEVGLPVLPQAPLQVVQQAGDEPGDRRTHALQGGAVEGVAQRPALAGVGRGVDAGQGAGQLLGGELLPAAWVGLALLPGEVRHQPVPAAQDLAACLERGDEVGAPGGAYHVPQRAQPFPDGQGVGLPLRRTKVTEKGNDGSAVTDGAAYVANGGHVVLLWLDATVTAGTYPST